MVPVVKMAQMDLLEVLAHVESQVFPEHQAFLDHLEDLVAQEQGEKLVHKDLQAVKDVQERGEAKDC